MGNNISIKNDFGIVIVGGLIFVVSFLWKDLLTDFEDYLFPKDRYSLLGRSVYVIVVTIFILSLVVFLRNILGLRSTKSSKFDDQPDDDISDITDGDAD